jgi:hypothetical protein
VVAVEVAESNRSARAGYCGPSTMTSRLPCYVAQNSIRVKSSWVTPGLAIGLVRHHHVVQGNLLGVGHPGLEVLAVPRRDVPDLMSATAPTTIIPSRSQNARDFSS